MNDKDLEYLLKHAKKYKRNTYKYAAVGTNSSHVTYLESSKVNNRIDRITNSRTTFTIFDKKNTELFNFTFPFYPNNNTLARDITKDKFIGEEFFSLKGFRTTNSKVYYWEELEKAYKTTFDNDTSRKVVIKPKDSSLGKGVYVNVSKMDFKKSWNLSIKELSKRNHESIDSLKYLVQDIIEGFEARATIMQGHLISIVVRIPPYVVGNGTSSINKLIEQYNKLRNKCSYQKKYPLIVTKKIESFLASNGRNVTDIPKNGEAVLLSSVSNVSAGGELFNVTDLVDSSIKEFALDVLASVPGMYSGGLDLILKSFDDPYPAILEANVYPNISIAKFPTYGKPANVSKIIFESLIAQTQLGLSQENKYDLDNEEKYIRDFIMFAKRKEKFVEDNHVDLVKLSDSMNIR